MGTCPYQFKNNHPRHKTGRLAYCTGAYMSSYIYTTARVFVMRICVSCAFPTHCTCVEFKLRMKRESTYFEIHKYSLAAL